MASDLEIQGDLANFLCSWSAWRRRRPICQSDLDRHRRDRVRFGGLTSCHFSGRW